MTRAQTLDTESHPDQRPAPPAGAPPAPRPARTLADRRHAAAVEQMAAELAEADPVDLFEDDLARKLGLERHPRLPLDEWRELRVRFIDRA